MYIKMIRSTKRLLFFLIYFLKNSKKYKYILKNTNLFVDLLILELFYCLFGPTIKL